MNHRDSVRLAGCEWTACVLLWLSSTAASGAEPGTARTWRDASDRFEITAQFVRRVGSRVILRGADGKELEVPYARLGIADRKFVDAQAGAPSTVPPNGAAEAQLVVVLSDKRPGYNILPGTVFAEADGFRYVAVGPIRADSVVGYFNTATGPAYAVVDSGGDARRVPLEKVGFNARSKLALLRAPQQELPPPFVPPATLPTFKRGDVVWFFGHEIRMDPTSPLIQPTAVEAVVRENYVNLQGEPRQFLAETVGTTKAAQGVLVDRHGAPISTAQAGLFGAARMEPEAGRSGRQRLEFNAIWSSSFEPLQKLLAPEVLSARSKLDYSADGVELVVQVQLVDVTSGTKRAALRLLAVDGDDDLNDAPDRFHFADGRWIDKPPTTGVELELQQVPQVDPQIEYSLTPHDWPHLQFWVGRLKIANPASRQFSYQCVFVDPDGKLRPLGSPGQFHYSVSSDELKKFR